MKTLIYSLLLLMYGCTTQVQPELMQAVDEKLAAQRSTEVDCLASRDPFCAIPSPLLYLGSMDVLNNQHHAALLDIGEDALKARLHLIRAARQSIEFQNFLFRKDQTGGLVMNELVQAAKRGVRVRVLLDQLFTVSELDYLAGLALEHSNFEVRLYNPLFNKAKTTRTSMFNGVTCCFTKTNQRMHSKLQVIDDVVAMTGGRNIADRYFDFDTDYNFKDREVLIYGKVAVDMRASFGQFWDSKYSAEVGYLRDVAPLIAGDDDFSLSRFEPADRLQPLLVDIEDMQLMRSLFIDTAHDVDSVEYFYDPPHDSEAEDLTQGDITDGLHAALAAAENSVVIQSPYLVLSKRSRKLFSNLRNDHPDIELLFSTNSLASTDAFSAYSSTYKHKKHYIKTLGFDVYEFRPYALDAADFFPRMPELIVEKKNGVSSGPIPAVGPNPALEMPGPRSGLHAKSFVIDEFVSMVGTHNLDPRGEGYNTENGVIIYDKEFAGELESSIRKDIEPGNSWVAAMKPPGLPVLGGINGAIESVSRSLPIFDIWPYRSTIMYELRPDALPLSPRSEDFYENYQPVGSFPGVISTKRRWQVILVSSFMGYITPVL
ncbi:MAG: phospholipase D family protein [Gammaproteobacteria bacterium]|nr:phospholipase D family protein [Gammaproteobacteria bacterium]